jgi:L,D-peptidoglycan transpeptidase YkuD (ErfK/YbiS/YcfS/YnhG family)
VGGLILFHGTKDRSGIPLTKINGTSGCIAMENDHLVELLGTFEPDGRPSLDIRP